MFCGNIRPRAQDRGGPVDMLDRQIITELQGDERPTTARLAEAVGLSASASLD